MLTIGLCFLLTWPANNWNTCRTTCRNTVYPEPCTTHPSEYCTTQTLRCTGRRQNSAYTGRQHLRAVCVHSRLQARREEAEAELARVGPPARRQRRALDAPGSPRPSGMSVPGWVADLYVDPVDAAHATSALGGEAQAAGSHSSPFTFASHLHCQIAAGPCLSSAPHATCVCLGSISASALASCHCIII